MIVIFPVTNKIYIKKIGNVSFNNSQAGMVYSIDSLFPTICAGTHGYAMGYIMEELKTKVKELKDKGNSIREIAKIMGISKSKVVCADNSNSMFYI